MAPIHRALGDGCRTVIKLNRSLSMQPRYTDASSGNKLYIYSLEILTLHLDNFNGNRYSLLFSTAFALWKTTIKNIKSLYIQLKSGLKHPPILNYLSMAVQR